MNSTTASALKGRQRSRDQRLAGARERRLQLDPDRLARDQRIDEATLDVEDAWLARAEAEAAVASAENASAAAIERLVNERLPLAEIADLTGLDLPTVRRLRHHKPPEQSPDQPSGPSASKPDYVPSRR